MRSAILKVTVPATIITSACLGEALGAIPKRSISYTVVPVTMNSNAQQAIPNVIGNIEESRAQLMRSSSAATITPPSSNFLSSSPFIGCDSSAIMIKGNGLFQFVIHFLRHRRLIICWLWIWPDPIEITICPGIREAQCQHKDKQDHFKQRDPSPKSVCLLDQILPAKDRRPGKEYHQFHFKQ